ncbi:MAG: flagellar basal body-associated FliL family protein [Amphritea sp.]|nr:flagellar basal body-associated FliL family protein [Amphritea sp.]
MAEENADAVEGGAEGGKKSGKMKLILIIVVTLLIGIGGAVGGMMFLMGGDSEAEEVEAKPATPARALYTKIRTLEGNPYFTVVVPSKDGKTHYLQAYVETKTRDDEVVAALTKHMPRIVSNLNRMLSSQSFEHLRTTEGKLLLQKAAEQEIQTILQEKIGKPGIEKVLFTGFIMQ